jgi:hypothetical protein
MRSELEEATAEVERLNRLSREAERGSEEHRELMAKLIRARKRLYGIQTGARRPRRKS